MKDLFPSMLLTDMKDAENGEWRGRPASPRHCG